ncbi:hypothetical protein TCAL_13621 [Tigriopus californicus]|uniref:Uncharacterized protein n=1 Tax=Tigriopus californicus TaxID=6832 RepID=A0A553P830_TIGCA|nr:CD151 antigen-like [Tigriopus californicus]TRY73842.1 hypothetical protein TCAL_13621 [Tigriopus californicus]|eukprot:TCALIF_13621-PA protein Name:"Similar to TSPAN11 Tetraspanin-11 (Homo sapiens)" AED:0.04 eAED:0.04 QI:138/1/1/1/0.5/0.6/5/103/298
MAQNGNNKGRHRDQHSLAENPRNEGCYSLTVLKLFFVIFNIIFLVSSIIIGGTGVWNHWTHWHILSLMTTITYSLITWLVIATGLLGIVGATIGCFGAKLEQRCSIGLYGFIVAIMFMMELILCMLSYSYHDQVELDLHQNLGPNLIRTYSVDRDITEAVDYIQQKLNCCGGDYYEDWTKSKWYFTASKRNKVPDSCCKTMSDACGMSDHPSNIPYTGCRHPMAAQIQSHLVLLGITGIGCALLQILGFVFTICLFEKLGRVGKMKSWQTESKKFSPHFTTSHVGYHPVFSNGLSNKT